MSAITLCMIVRNEEEVLARCLASVRELVDEIIIVDTGSTDATIKIARGFGAAVHQFDWIDDFAAARNYSFSFATSPYILWLDADDVVEPDQLAELLALKARLHKDVYYLQYDYAQDASGRSLCTFYRERIVRRAPGIRWQYPIHECLSVGSAHSSERVEIAIRHARTEAGALADEHRNLRILERAIAREEYAGSARIRYYLGKEYLDNGRPAEAIEHLRLFLAMPDGWVEDRIGAQQRIARAFRDLARTHPEEAERYTASARAEAKRARAMDGRWAEPHFLLGEIAFDEGDYEEAAFWFEMCRRGVPPVLSPVNLYCYNAGPAVQLCLCHARLGKTERAQEFNDEALLYYPNDPNLLGNRASFAETIERRRLEREATERSDISGTVAVSDTGAAARIDGRPLLVIHTGAAYEPWTSANLNTGIGGAETAAARLAEELERLGNRVVVFSSCDGLEGAYNGVEYLDYGSFDRFAREHAMDVCILSRYASLLRTPINAARRYLWLHDITAAGTPLGAGDLVRAHLDAIDGVVCLSPWHRENVMRTHGIPEEKIAVIGNAVDPAHFSNGTARTVERIANRCIYASSPDRGLEALLVLFPLLRELLPGAELHIYHGFETLDARLAHRADSDALHAAMQQPGVFHHGRVGQAELAREFLRSDLWFHPTSTAETYCITALEAQMGGAICVSTRLGALETTVGDRGVLIDGNPGSAAYSVAALRAITELQRDPQRKEELRAHAREWASEQTWRARAGEWARLFGG